MRGWLLRLVVGRPVECSANLSESTAWAIYRDRLKPFGALIGDREPIVPHKEIEGMGRAERYTITIAEDDRAALDKLCRAPPVTCFATLPIGRLAVSPNARTAFGWGCWRPSARPKVGYRRHVSRRLRPPVPFPMRYPRGEPGSHRQHYVSPVAASISGPIWPLRPSRLAELAMSDL
jgi:hypothetical protein